MRPGHPVHVSICRLAHPDLPVSTARTAATAAAYHERKSPTSRFAGLDLASRRRRLRGVTATKGARRLRILHAGLACRRLAAECGPADPTAHPPHCRDETLEASAWPTDELSMLSMSRSDHGHRRRAGDDIGNLICIGAGHRYRRQRSTLRAANLDGPAPPFAANLDTQIESDELRQIERPLGRRKFSHPKMSFRALRAHKGDAVLGHGTPGAIHPRNTVIKAALMFSYAND